MTYIDGLTYETLANSIGDAYAASKAVQPFIQSGLDIVLLLDQAEQEYDLLPTWFTTNDNSTRTTNDPSSFTPLAIALNNHITLRTGLDVNTYLSEEETRLAITIELSSDFAIVSQVSGTLIDCEFIADPENFEPCTP